MTEKIKLAVISLLISTFIYGCSSKPPLEEMEPEKMFSYLQERFVEEKYLDVIEGLEFFTLNYSGNVKVDSAEFLLGQAHFHIKEYLIAADVFNEMNRRF
ncbi:hypothetical protein H8D57_00725, partial [bacterium]|nr:hypothetical protein [bacterium]